MKYFQVKCLTSLQNKVINNFFPTNKQLIKSPLVQTFSYCFRFNYNSTATWVDTKTQNYAFWIVIIKKGQFFYIQFCFNFFFSFNSDCSRRIMLSVKKMYSCPKNHQVIFSKHGDNGNGNPVSLNSYRNKVWAQHEFSLKLFLQEPERK